MSRIAIFLRGINLGKRRLTKDMLIRPFTSAGFEGVETFIASGNVVIDDPDLEPAELEARIEGAVLQEFGFEADAFARPIRTLAELVAQDRIVEPESEGFTPHVMFLKQKPSAGVDEALAELETDDDRFLVMGREVVWLRRGRLTDSTIEQRHLEKALQRAPNTMRKITTLRRMAAKFGK